MPEIPDLAKARLKRQPPESHPAAELLNAFVEQQLPAGERQGVLKHLAVCSECREVIHLSLPEADVAAVGTAADAKPRRALLPWLRWSALAATVAIAASVTLYMEHEAVRTERQTYTTSEITTKITPTAKSAQKDAPQNMADARSASAPPAESQKQEKAASANESRQLAKVAPGVAPPQPSRAEKLQEARVRPLKDYDQLSTKPGSTALPTVTGQAGFAPKVTPSAPPAADNLQPKPSAADANLAVAGAAKEMVQVEPAPGASKLESKNRPSTQTAAVVAGAGGGIGSGYGSGTARATAAKTSEVSADEVATRYYKSQRAAEIFTTWRISGSKLEVADRGTWKDTLLPGDIHVQQVIEQPQGELWVLSSEGKLYRSTKRSAPWGIVDGGWSGKVKSLVFFSRDDGQAIAEGGAWNTHDGGKSWSKQPAR